VGGYDEMRIDVGRTSGKRNDRKADAVAIAVLAGQWIALVQLTDLQHWIIIVAPSRIFRVLVYAFIFIAMAIWGLAIWPKIQRTKAWVSWTVGFGALGWLFLYLSVARNYGRGFSFIYGPLFIGQAMIGVAGLARLMSVDFVRRMK